MDKFEKLLTALIPAISSIHDGCGHCANDFVGRANIALENIDVEYRYFLDKENIVILAITDGYENYYPARCEKCGLRNHIVRPGKFQCPNGCER